MLVGKSIWAAAIGLPALFAFAGCTGELIVIDEELTPVVATHLDDVFARVGAETGVPADLLEAIGYVETRWQMVEADEEHDGRAPSVGLMAIRADQVAHAAALAGVDEQDLALVPEANIRAAAALLLEAAGRVGPSLSERRDLGAWAPAVAEYSGIADDDSRASYVIGSVYQVLRNGAAETAESGEPVASLGAHPDVVPDYDYVAPTYATGTDYTGAVWKPSPNYGSRPAGTAGKIAMVIIHTCEGAYAGCAGWLRNTASGVSAHYVVNESGSEISQLVREASRAYHIGATYKCSLNSSTDCTRNGAGSNNFTVGIEHGGFGSQASWPAGQIEASARLVCDVTRRNAIPRDRQHIVGHGQLQPYNRSDPGPNWPWSSYLERIKTLCNDTGGGGDTSTPPPTQGAPIIIVDSNSANNDAARARVTIAGTWTSANSTPGYYGSGYWYADTSSTPAPATFSFYADAAGTRTVEAWWTAGTNRASAATFVVRNAAGTEVGRVAKNQQLTGSQWAPLGSFAVTAGWNTVELSRAGTAGKVVVADAIRVR